jgi:hypothetical protein
MGTLIKSSTLARAEVLLAIIQTLLTEDDPDLLVSTFRNGKISGYHLSSASSSLEVNIAGEHNGDGFVVTFGAKSDGFDRLSYIGNADDAVDFGPDRAYDAAQYALKCLRPRVLRCYP